MVGIGNLSYSSLTFRCPSGMLLASQRLSDVIQGFLALARLQGARDPAYRSMLDSVALTADGTSVSVSFDVTPAALDLLTPSNPSLRGPAAPRRQ